MLKSLFFILAIASLLACNNAEEEIPSGGYCGFDTLAQAVAVKTVLKDSIGVAMVLAGSGHDSIYHFIPFNIYRDSLIARRDSVQVGDTFQLLRIRSVKGSCADQPSIIAGRNYTGNLGIKY